MKLYYPAVLERRGRCFRVFAPDIPGCEAYGASAEEACRLAGDSALLALEQTAESSPLPKPSDISKLAGEGLAVLLLELEMPAPSPKRDERAVKKTLTIPAWLNELAEREHVNFSGVLKSALLEKLGQEDTPPIRKKGANAMHVTLYLIEKPGEGNSKHFWSFEPIRFGGSDRMPNSRDFILPEGFTVGDDGFGGKAAFRGEDSFMLCTQGNLPIFSGCGEQIRLHPAADPKR